MLCCAVLIDYLINLCEDFALFSVFHVLSAKFPPSLPLECRLTIHAAETAVGSSTRCITERLPGLFSLQPGGGA